MNPFRALLFVVCVATVVAQPDLNSVPVASRAKPLTNARVQSVTERGITFACDQGIVQVPFEKLPPAFREFYSQHIKPPSQPPSQPKPKQSVAQEKHQRGAPTKAAAKEQRPKTEKEKAEAAKKRAEKLAQIASKIAHFEANIATYERQSSFTSGFKVSTEDYNLAKASLAEARLEQQALQAQPVE